MRVTFVAPSARRPVGGATLLYELATALADRDVDVQLVHLDVWDDALSAPEQIRWFRFPGAITHHFLPGRRWDGGRDLPHADVLIGFSPEWTTTAAHGLPVVPVQGYRMFRPEVEHAGLRAPCPKICVARWLVGVGRDLGVPGEQLVHVPPGLRHDKYRITRPIAGRAPRVAYCYNSHVSKAAPVALEVLDAVREEVPGMEAVVFASVPPEHDIPGWIDVRVDPSQTELVEDVYNGSRVFLSTSTVEGFGMPCIEAMACGAALVTTDNGGSRDYARHAETALVSPAGDVASLIAQVRSLLVDDDACADLATAGADSVQAFRWERSGARLHALLEAYLREPGAFGATAPPESSGSATGVSGVAGR